MTLRDRMAKRLHRWLIRMYERHVAQCEQRLAKSRRRLLVLQKSYVLMYISRTFNGENIEQYVDRIEKDQL